MHDLFTPYPVLVCDKLPPYVDEVYPMDTKNAKDDLFVNTSLILWWKDCKQTQQPGHRECTE